MFAKTFRNTLIASTLVVAGAALATPAMAQSVPLGGSVVDNSSVTVENDAAAAAAADLDLGGLGTAQTDIVVKVANLSLFTNSDSGATLTVTGDDSARLSNGEDPASFVSYVVLIAGDEAANITSASFSGATGTDTEAVNDFDASGDSARDLYIMYSTDTNLDPGAYTGSITVDLVAL